MSEINIGIAGFGFYLPENKVSVKELGKNANLPDKVISYIGAEYVTEANDDELPSSMGIEAAKNVLNNAGISASEVDVIINAPAGLQDYVLPPMSGAIQHGIGAENAICFDVVQGCCGMLTAIELAKNYIMSGSYNTVLIVSSDKWSAYTEHHTAEAVIFGDGAGAVIVKKGADNFLLKDFMFKTAGKFFNLYGIPGGGVKDLNSTERFYKCLFPDVARKDFKDLYISSFSEVAKKLLNKNRLKISNISYLSMVNANLKLLEVVANDLGIPLVKTSKDLLIRYGHIGGFDIFFNIYKAFLDKKIKKGDKLLLLNAGIGFTWGCGLIEV